MTPGLISTDPIILLLNHPLAAADLFLSQLLGLNIHLVHPTKHLQRSTTLNLDHLHQLQHMPPMHQQIPTIVVVVRTPKCIHFLNCFYSRKRT